MDNNSSSESAMDDASVDESEQEHEFDYDIDEGDDDDPHDDYEDVPDDEDDMDEDDDDDGGAQVDFTSPYPGLVNEVRLLNPTDSFSFRRFPSAAMYSFEHLMVEGAMISIPPRGEESNALRSVMLESMESFGPRSVARHFDSMGIAEPLEGLPRLRGSFPPLTSFQLRDVETVSTVHPHLQRPRMSVRTPPMSTAEAVFSSLTSRNSDMHASLFGERAQQTPPARDHTSTRQIIADTMSNIHRAHNEISSRSPAADDTMQTTPDVPLAPDVDAVTPAPNLASNSTPGRSSSALTDNVRSEPGQNLDSLAELGLLRSVSGFSPRQSVDASMAFMNRSRGPYGRPVNRDRDRDKISSGILKRWVYDPPSCGGDSLPAIFDADSGQKPARHNSRTTLSSQTQPLVALEEHESVNQLSSKIVNQLDSLLVDLHNIDDTLRQRERQEEAEKEAREKKAEEEKQTSTQNEAAENSPPNENDTSRGDGEPANLDAAVTEAVSGERRNAIGSEENETDTEALRAPSDDDPADNVEEEMPTASPSEMEASHVESALPVNSRPSDANTTAIPASDAVMSQPDESPSSPEIRQEETSPTNGEAANNQETDATDFAAVAARRAAAAGISLDAPANENPEVVAAATESTGIDPAFLAALPDEMRTEILTQYYEQIRTNTGPDTGAASSPAATTVNQDFLIALPPALRAEVLELEAEFQSRHESGQGAAANGQGGATGSQPGAPGDNAASGMAAAEMDNASFLATLTPDLREEILLTSGESFIQSLPPSVVAEARVLRERDINTRMPWRLNGDEGGMPFSRRAFPSGFRPGSSLQGRRGERNHSRVAPIYRWKKVGDGWLREGPKVADEPTAALKQDGLEALVNLLWLRQGQYGKSLVYQVFSHACKTTASRQQVLRQLIKLITSSTSQDRNTGSSKEPRLELDRSRHHGTAVRRGLELLAPLCKNDAVVSETLLGLPQTIEQVKSLPIEVPKDWTIPESLSFEISLATLISLLNTPLFQRSNSHLEQLVGVISTICQVIPASKYRYSSRTPDNRSRTPAERSSQHLEATEEILIDGGRFISVEGDDGSREVLHVPEDGEEEDIYGDLGQHLRERNESPRREEDAAGASDSESEVSIPVQFRVPFLRKNELEALTKVLLRPGCSERTYSRASRAIGELGELPSNREVFVRSLVSIAIDAGADILEEYVAFIAALDKEEDSSRKRTNMIASFSVASASNELTLLRVVKSFSALQKHEASQAKDPEPICSTDGIDDQSNEVPSGHRQFQPYMLTGLQDLWDSLDKLLELISDDDGLKERRERNKGGSSRSRSQVVNLDHLRSPNRGLSPILARLSPMIEAFLVTHSSEEDSSQNDSTMPQVPSSPSQSSSEAIVCSPGTSSKTLEGSLDTTAKQKDGELSTFVERHRSPINALLRANPALLESSFRGALRHPHAIDFDNKKAYFRNVIRHRSSEAHAGTIRINVRRERVLDDSYHQLRMRTADEMKGRLHIQFTGEEGVDAGGVTREWYIILVRQIFDPNYVLFCRSAAKAATYQPDKRSYINREHLETFKFVGRIIGKAIYDGQLLDAYFTRSFYKHILGVRPVYHDIEAQDPDYYKSLKWILENDITGILYQPMSAEYDEFGKQIIIDLVPNGRNILVTEENKEEYVRLVTEVRMTKAIEKQIEAFKEGFYELIPHKDCKIFNELELELLMSGLPDIDMADLKANVEYTGYTASSPQINWFWRVVGKMDQEDLARLVMFVTGTSKVPLEGFSTLQGMNGVQKFQIHRVAGNTMRLPSAHTCFNQLDLPEYSSAEILSERLLRAVRECSVGFGFA